jgi:hypothetical protein
LVELGFGIPEYLRFVPVDFESGGSWSDEAGFKEVRNVSAATCRAISPAGRMAFACQSQGSFW